MNQLFGAFERQADATGKARCSVGPVVFPIFKRDGMSVSWHDGSRKRHDVRIVNGGRTVGISPSTSLHVVTQIRPWRVELFTLRIVALGCQLLLFLRSRHGGVMMHGCLWGIGRGRRPFAGHRVLGRRIRNDRLGRFTSLGYL